MSWVQGTLSTMPGDVLAIDGKTIRRSEDRRRGQGALHLVSAWASGRHLVPGQEATDAKSNEITAIPLLLARLDLADQILTIDAMGCQRGIAAHIIAGGGDYVLALKENQPDLWADVLDSFAVAPTPDDSVRTVEKDHGRRETRVCATIADAEVIAWLDPDGAWPRLRTITRVTATRCTGDAPVGMGTPTIRYYLSNLPGDAQPIAEAVRSHCGIENRLHWAVDVAFREADNRAHTGHGPESLARIRNLALNLLRLESTRTHGIKASRLRAGWDDAYLLRVLGIIEMQSPCLSLTA